MQTAVMIILAIVCVLLILSIMLQPSNSDGLSNSITGGAEQLFGQKKVNGYQAILHKVTIVMSVLFVVLSLVLLVFAK